MNHRALSVLTTLFLVACSSKPAPKAEAPEPPREAGPEVALAINHARIGRVGSMRDALGAALREEHKNAASRAATLQRQKPPASASTSFTLLFSSNNHGELEDCGCRRKPMGGLDRRKTLIDWVTQPDEIKAPVYWGEGLDTPKHLFYADAGDMLFRILALADRPKKEQDAALRQAKGVVDAMNLLQPDAVNVGERDLSLGLASLKKVTAKAKFPLISANLKDAKGKQVFPGHVVTRRGGRTLAYIGVTKSEKTRPGYYHRHGVRVGDAMSAIHREVASLPSDVDLVVLLSNEGIPETTKLVEALQKRKVRVDVVLASGSNRMTREPTWVGHVPIVEPLNRGKYFGRLDMVRVGTREQPLTFLNKAPDSARVLREYERAWKSVTESQLMSLRAENEMLEARIKGLAVTSARVETLRKRTEKANRRAKLGMSTVLELGTQLEALSKAEGSPGDDWLDVRIVPVSLSIPQEPGMRKVLDRYKK